MDIDTLQTLLTKAVFFTPITTGIVSAVKVTGLIPLRLLPVCSICIGCVFGWFFIAYSAVGILCGIALGLAATGLFEFSKTTVAGR